MGASPLSGTNTSAPATSRYAPVCLMKKPSSPFLTLIFPKFPPTRCSAKSLFPIRSNSAEYIQYTSFSHRILLHIPRYVHASVGKRNYLLEDIFQKGVLNSDVFQVLLCTASYAQCTHQSQNLSGADRNREY